MQNLIVTIFLTFSLLVPSYGKVTENDLTLLEEYKKTLQLRDIKTQCVGDCYLISTVTLLEELVSQKLGEKVTISMIDLYQLVLVSRIKNTYIRDLFRGPYDAQKTFKELGDILIFDSGNTLEVLNLIIENPIYIGTPLNFKEKQTLQKNLERYHQDIEIKINQLDEKLRKDLRDLASYHSERLKHKIELHISLLLQEKQAALEAGKKEHNIILDEALHYIYELTDQNTHSIQDLLYLIDLIEEYTREHPFMDSPIQSFQLISGGQEGLLSEAKKVKKFFKSKKEQLIERVTSIMLNYSINLDSFKGSQIPGQKRKIQIEDVGAIIDESYSEKDEFLDFLNEDKFPAIFSYLHLETSYFGKGQNLGIQAGENLPVYKKEPGELHQTYLIDSIKDKEGNVRFLVSQNSWGRKFGYKGLSFIHISHLPYFEEIEYIDFNDYDVKVLKTCNSSMRVFGN